MTESTVFHPRPQPLSPLRGVQVLMGVLRKELEPGLHISRRTRDDFHRFLRVARFFTSFVRLREACEGRCKPLTADLLACLGYWSHNRGSRPPQAPVLISVKC